jgi:hypothetical protein
MPTVRVRVTSRASEQVGQPILYRLGKDYNVTTNLRRAQVTDESAMAEVELTGAIEEVHRAIAWLHTTGLQVDALDRSVGDGSNL